MKYPKKCIYHIYIPKLALGSPISQGSKPGLRFVSKHNIETLLSHPKLQLIVMSDGSQVGVFLIFEKKHPKNSPKKHPEKIKKHQLKNTQKIPYKNTNFWK